VAETRKKAVEREWLRFEEARCVRGLEAKGEERGERREEARKPVL